MNHSIWIVIFASPIRPYGCWHLCSLCIVIIHHRNFWYVTCCTGELADGLLNHLVFATQGLGKSLLEIQHAVGAFLIVITSQNMFLFWYFVVTILYKISCMIYRYDISPIAVNMTYERINPRYLPFRMISGNRLSISKWIYLRSLECRSSTPELFYQNHFLGCTVYCNTSQHYHRSDYTATPQ